MGTCEKGKKCLSQNCLSEGWEPGAFTPGLVFPKVNSPYCQSGCAWEGAEKALMAFEKARKQKFGEAQGLLFVVELSVTDCSQETGHHIFG